MASRYIHTIAQKKFDWVHVTKADKDIMQEVGQRFNIEPNDLQDVLPPNQRSKMVARDGYVFLIMHMPIYNRTTCRIAVTELYFFVNRTSFISVVPNDVPSLTRLFKDLKEKKDTGRFSSPGEMFFQVVNLMMHDLFPMLVHMGNDIEEVQNDIFDVKHHHRENVKEILRIKTNIVSFKRSVQPYKAIMEKYAEAGKGTYLVKGVNLGYIRELSIEIWQLLASQESTINDLHETHESLINNRTNEIMRTLTIFSVIVFPLTLLAAVFGMNTVNTPIIGDPYDFWQIVGIMLAGIVVMIFFFRKKRWL